MVYDYIDRLHDVFYTITVFLLTHTSNPDSGYEYDRLLSYTLLHMISIKYTIYL